MHYPRTAPYYIFSCITLSIGSVNSFKTISIFLPQNIMHKRACQLQDRRHACLFHLAMRLVVQNACPRPGPFLASIRLNKPFLSDKLLMMKVFVWHLS